MGAWTKSPPRSRLLRSRACSARKTDARLWARVSLDQGAHEAYGRVRGSYLDFNTGDSFDCNDDDWEGPQLDRGWYQFRLKNAMRAYARTNVPYDLRVKAGRQYVGRP